MEEVTNFFGYMLCSSRNVIECAFGHLKVRFSPLRRDMDINSADLPSVIYVCFVLHNFCEENKDSVSEEQVKVGAEITTFSRTSKTKQ